MMSENVEECTFSIALSDRDALKKLSVKTGGREQATVFGSLGEILEVNYVEGVVLQIKGSRGVMDIGISKEKLAGLASKKKR